MAELNFAAGTARTTLLDAAMDVLQKEFQTRLQHLRARKADIEHLQALAECIAAHGWHARADVVAMQFTGVILRLHITVASAYEQTRLFDYFSKECIDCARTPSHDALADHAYTLTLGGGITVKLRVSVAKAAPGAAAA